MKTITIPDDIVLALDNGAALVSSVSGGKDSDAMTLELMRLRYEHKWTGRWILIHADVGRMEWAQSLPHCKKLAERVGAEFVVVRHAKRDLMDNIWLRMENRPDAPPFPAPAYRQCTSDFKRGPINKWARNEFPQDQEVIMCMGLRAEESTARAKKKTCMVRKAASSEKKNRQVIDWLPIHDWTEAEVWNTIGLSMDELRAIQESVKNGGLVPADFPAHPAYAYGNERCSCACCIMGSIKDLMNGAQHQPDQYRELCRIEMVSGYSFRQNLWLCSLRPDLLDEDVRQWWNERQEPIDNSPKPVQDKMFNHD